MTKPLDAAEREELRQRIDSIDAAQKRLRANQADGEASFAFARGNVELQHWLRARADRILAESEELERRSLRTCLTCGGSPHASGLTCICGGSGRIEDEVDGLRRHAFKTEADLAAEREVVRDLRVKLDEVTQVAGELRAERNGLLARYDELHDQRHAEARAVDHLRAKLERLARLADDQDAELSRVHNSDYPWRAEMRVRIAELEESWRDLHDEVAAERANRENNYGGQQAGTSIWRGASLSIIDELRWRARAVLAKKGT